MSLGINLMPNDGKICSFDCLYCEAGFNAQGPGKDGIPSRETVKRQLKRKLEEMKDQGQTLDVITFSGNGEPTLHPEFKKVVEDVYGWANCEGYGRLYTWKAAQNACPNGWRLPTDSELPAIVDNVERLQIEASGNRDVKGKYGWPPRAEFWTSGATGSKGKFYYYDLSTKTGKFDTFNKKAAKSVRCVKK